MNDPAAAANPTGPADPAERAREHVLDAHAGTVEIVLACADAVASEWPDGSATDRGAVADPLRRALEAADAWARLPDALAGAVRAAGFSLSAPPVAAPPYVAVTSRGPVLRATVPAGRLVVLLCTFDVERGDSTRYVRGATTPDSAVRATFKPRRDAR
ncbi:hypothetical protein [Halorussus amylolyticus]|uniref:hypothetical protein n=1 Tax=Halorussus amylolyticus TaxID=1126242 RepID=UPI001EE46A03|nr:hypothetical protein [Halorussus amylolyticus]